MPDANRPGYPGIPRLERVVVMGRAEHQNVFVGPLGRKIELGARQHP